MKLYIKDRLVSADIENIILRVKAESPLNIFSDVRRVGDWLMVSCPYHKNGQELHASSGFYSREDGDIEFGKFHCFACGANKSLAKVISDCFNEKDISFGEEWLLERFGGNNSVFDLPPIELGSKFSAETFLDENILKKYRYYHPYMFKRKLTKEIIDKFGIGFDKDTNSITFPVYDERGRLCLITKRSVNTKSFYIDKDKRKPVYLLNEIIKDNIKSVFVTESQINALTLWSWGIPAVATFGCNVTDNQFEALKKTDINVFNVAFDGDASGDKGAMMFFKKMPMDRVVNKVILPRGKDINDLSYDEFKKLKIVNRF